MEMLDKVTIDSVDVTDYRISWQVNETWGKYIDSATVVLIYTVKDILTIESGMEIEISRGFTTSTDNVIFIGQVTQVSPGDSSFTLVCKNRMIDTIKSSQTKSWDMNIDIEAGVGSEIFKDICDNSGIDYTPAKETLTDGSIICTGTTTSSKIVKFLQNDEDDYQKLNELADLYTYIITYDYDNDRVNFKPKGYTAYPVTLNVGTEIPVRIQWKENMEQLINKVKIQGATVYDKIPESFAGPATEFTLAKTPEDTEVYINSTTTNDIQTRGQKDIGVLGTDFDYYIDVDQKKVVFSGAVSNMTINYGAQVPLPIILKNVTSIEKYGGPNKKPHFKKFAFTDIKDRADAENRGRAILAKYSLPFTEANNIQISDDTINTYGYIEPGTLVRVVDTFKDKDLTLFVNNVVKSFPHTGDKISFGDAIWRTEDWQAHQMEKINLLFNELNKNQDILIQTIDLDRSVTFERRYMYLDIKNVTGDSFILGHTRFGLLGTSLLGDTGSGTWQTIRLLQGNNTYKEYLYDDTFKDAGETTAAWRPTNWASSNWGTDADIITGLSGIAFDSAPVVFTKDDDLYLISGTRLGNFNGFKWNETTTQWDSNGTIITGLGDIGAYSTPTVFTKDGDLYLISGENTGVFFGFKWNETTTQWDTNTDIIAGLGDIGFNSTPTVFTKDGDLYLISGKNTGVFSGFKWNESTTQWDTNTDIITGLSYLGNYIHPTTFIKDSILYLVVGEQDGSFNGFDWNTNTLQWDSNTSIVSDLGDAGSISSPTVFTKDSDLYLISGKEDGAFNGFKLNNIADKEITFTANNWDVDATIKTGLTGYSQLAIATFELDDSLYMVRGASSGGVYGTKWNTGTSQWDDDTDFDVADYGSRAVPTVFYIGSDLYMIVGYEGFTSEYTGWKWNTITTQWDSDADIIVGLSTADGNHAPHAFYKDSELYMIVCDNNDTFIGYKWNVTDAEWETDTDIITGLVYSDTYTRITTFEVFDKLYAITTDDNGLFTGYVWNTSTIQWDADTDIVTNLNGTLTLYTCPTTFTLDGDLYLLAVGFTTDWNFLGWKVPETEIAQTLEITKGIEYSYFTVTIGASTGTLLYEISGDGGVTWQSVTLNVRTAFNVTDNTSVKFRIINNGSTAATVINTYKTGGDYDAPAIKIKLEE